MKAPCIIQDALKAAGKYQLMQRAGYHIAVQPDQCHTILPNLHWFHSADLRRYVCTSNLADTLHCRLACHAANDGIHYALEHPSNLHSASQQMGKAKVLQ